MDVKHKESDHDVFVSNNRFIAIYIDDMLIFCQYDSKLQKLQK